MFFAENFLMASVMNFYSDSYSSTICALNFPKSAMEKDTVIIFDELIINEGWEQAKFKSLNKFYSIN